MISITKQRLLEAMKKMESVNQLVHVRWYDTTVFALSAGQPYQVPFPTVVQAVGWVVYEDSTFLEIRSAYARPSSGNPDRTIFSLFIPKGAINYRTVLTDPGTDSPNVGVDWGQVQSSIDKSMPYTQQGAAMDDLGAVKENPKPQKDYGQQGENPKISPEQIKEMIAQKYAAAKAEQEALVGQVAQAKPKAWPHPASPAIEPSGYGKDESFSEFTKTEEAALDIDTATIKAFATTGDFKESADGPSTVTPPSTKDLTGSK